MKCMSGAGWFICSIGVQGYNSGKQNFAYINTNGDLLFVSMWISIAKDWGEETKGSRAPGFLGLGAAIIRC